MKILFVTWDGPQTFYLEGLFLPIFKRLSERGFAFHVLQFTWGGDQIIQRSRAMCESAGLSYRAVRVWRRPLAFGSLFTAVKGCRDIRRAIRDWDIDVVMPRSTLPALSSLLALRSREMPMIFDADGLPIDERVDFGSLRPTSVIYRVLRNIEAQAVRRASIVLTRTRIAIDILRVRGGVGTNSSKFRAVRNGRDAELFSSGEGACREQTRADIQVSPKAPLIVYAGSIGPQYCLPEMLRFFSFVREANSEAQLLILTGSSDAVLHELASWPDLVEFVTTMRVDGSEVPRFIASADLGLALRQPSFSMQAVAPLKIGEYLLCGLPVLATDGIGESGRVLNSEVGYLTKKMDDMELRGAADWFLGTVIPDRAGYRSRCRETGILEFSIESAARDYREALETAMQLSGSRKIHLNKTGGHE